MRKMKTAWYERQGPASEVLVIGEMAVPKPAAGEVCIRISASGVNPGDVKKRQNTFGVGLPYPRIVPHSDGAGVIEEVGTGVSPSRVGERVWCFGAQSYRPFGTAAEYCVVPTEQAVRLPDKVSFVQGACLGIPGLTAHRAVHIAGALREKVVLVQGAAGAVGQCAVAIARHAGAIVIASVRSAGDTSIAQRAGAHHIVTIDPLSADATIEGILSIAPEGIDHIIEVAFDTNIEVDERLLKLGGSIATYATGRATPTIPFWQLIFKNVALYFLGSDDFPVEAKKEAARSLNTILEAGWLGYEIQQTFPLEDIASAHEFVEKRAGSGRVVITITGAGAG